MSVEDAVLEKLRVLPPERQQEALDFIEFLAQKSQPVQPRRPFLGRYAHLGVHITKEEIDEARREMWKNFPRDFPE